MTVAIDDLPPLMWHAELGSKLLDLWTNKSSWRATERRPRRRRAMAAPLRAAVLATPAHSAADPRAGGAPADCDRTDERDAVPHHGPPDRPVAPRPDTHGQRLDPGLPRLVHKKVRERAEQRKATKRELGLQTAYCAETVAITYEEMGLITTEKNENWFDPGRFWSGDTLPLESGYTLGDEIEVLPD